jgi:hypothetical protein
MKKIFKQRLIVSVISAMSLVSLPSYAGNGPGGAVQASAQTSNTVVDTQIALNQTEIDYLLQMREEEKVARDVYLNLYERWQLMPFSNIAGSEQSHMDQVKVVMDAYQLADIALADRGQFNNAELQALYDDLVQKGADSSAAALSVGALVEEVDIKDLQLAIAATSNPALISMYTGLLLASENHLRAFVRNSGQGLGSYSAQVLPQTEVDRILSGQAPTEVEVIGRNPTIALDTDNNSRTDAGSNFSATLSNGQSATSDFSQADRANLMVKWTVAAQDQQQDADVLVVAMYQADNNAPVLNFAKNANGAWQAWNGDLKAIPSQSKQRLGTNLSISALSSLPLNGLQGTILVYTGYRLGARLVTQAQPVQLQVH